VTPLVLDVPGAGLWEARNSPTRRVPSHGTSRFGTAYADRPGSRGRTPSERQAVVADASRHRTGFCLRRFRSAGLSADRGNVVATHDHEPDHDASRSPVAYLFFALGQAKRIRSGISAVAGNHVVIEVAPGGPYVLMAHLQHGSLCVSEGQQIEVGAPVGACGNTGNSTQPHVHLQAVDSLSWETANAIPIVFRSYRVVATRTDRLVALPAEGETIARS